MTSMRLPWRFMDRRSEEAYESARVAGWSAGPDEWVSLPWALVWVSIIARHWSALTWHAIARSAVHFTIICSPAYLKHIIGKERYFRYRNYIVIASLVSYVLHPGGGLYRDSLMSNVAEQTDLNAFNLFIRMLVGSRTLFWLILVFGYELPPSIGIPVNALCLLVMNRLKPSRPFCTTMQNLSTHKLFRTIATSLPVISVIRHDHPQLSSSVDICNPLVNWLQFTLGFLLPAVMHLAQDYNARIKFARAHPRQLTRRDRTVWKERSLSSFSPWPVAGLMFVGLSSLLWHAVLLRQPVEI